MLGDARWGGGGGCAKGMVPLYIPGYPKEAAGFLGELPLLHVFEASFPCGHEVRPSARRRLFQTAS